MKDYQHVSWFLILKLLWLFNESYFSHVSGNTQDILKYLSLASLTLQNALLILVMRFVRTREGEMFMATTAVIVSEVLKFSSCLIFILYKEGSMKCFIQRLREDIIQQPLDCLKVSIPSLIYTLQNNLLYIAVSNLDAATFQVKDIWNDFMKVWQSVQLNTVNALIEAPPLLKAPYH